MPTFDERFSEIYRRESGRCLATLIRLTRDVDDAEDALAEAFAAAADLWERDGFPANPGGWITTTARNKAIDRRRRESTRDDRQRAASRVRTDDETVDQPTDLGPVDAVPDDQLRLIFLSCHPELAPDAKVGLTLRLVCGLTTAEIARAFLVPEPTMAQRLVRAKRRVRERQLEYRIPAGAELPDRLDAVLASLYLMFTEAHTAAAGPDLSRVDLAEEAIRVTRVLRSLLPAEPEVAGLLALLLLTDARRPARTDPGGAAVRLGDQDRTRWNRGFIDEGIRLVRACVAADRPGPYQLQASIAAVHADASSAESTDWPQIVSLYDHLLRFLPTPIVELNRAVAVAEVGGPAAGLEALEGLPLEELHLFHATRAEFLLTLGRSDAAALAFDRAIALAANERERAHLERRRLLSGP